VIVATSTAIIGGLFLRETRTAPVGVPAAAEPGKTVA